jgi:hypothetical protein
MSQYDPKTETGRDEFGAEHTENPAANQTADIRGPGPSVAIRWTSNVSAWLNPGGHRNWCFQVQKARIINIPTGKVN